MTSSRRSEPAKRPGSAALSANECESCGRRDGGRTTVPVISSITMRTLSSSALDTTTLISYFVRNSEELTATLEMLLAGKDRLREKRRELIKSLLFLPKEGAGLRIKEML